MSQTQLLCTFCTVETLDHTINDIVNTYDIAFDSIYVLENTLTEGALCCTYNIYVDVLKKMTIPANTISLHRKKATNTLYTINALNSLVKSLNGGKLDKQFQVSWTEYKNSILVTTHNELKIIPTKLHSIIKLSAS